MRVWPKTASYFTATQVPNGAIWNCSLPAWTRQPVTGGSFSCGFCLYYGLGKTVVLLWQSWLVAGPTWQNMKTSCSNVRPILGDLGVETLIVKMPGVALVEFLSLIRSFVLRTWMRTLLTNGCSLVPS